MVLLTATLPPCEQKTLQERMGWKEGEGQWFRMPTARKQTRYSVVQPERKLRPSEHDALVARMVEEEIKQKDDVKGVVYCSTVRRVDRFIKSGLFKSEGFHGKIEDSEKGEVLERFRTGETRVVVATNALGLGVDIPDIDFIIHADEPRDMLDYAQESGRAGRDGRTCKAVIVTGCWRSDDSLVHEYIYGESSCRRKIMSMYLDGITDRAGCEEDEERCDVCEARSRDEREGEVSEEIIAEEEVIEGTTENTAEVNAMRQEYERQQRQSIVIQQRGTTQVQNDARMLERVERQLQAWKGRCVVCRGLGAHDRHAVVICKHEAGGKEAGEEVKMRRQRIRFDDFAACYRCGVMQSICTRWEDNGNGGWRDTQGPCQYYGIMAAVVFGLQWGFHEVWKEWMKRL